MVIAAMSGVLTVIVTCCVVVGPGQKSTTQSESQKSYFSVLPSSQVSGLMTRLLPQPSEVGVRGTIAFVSSLPGAPPVSASFMVWQSGPFASALAKADENLTSAFARQVESADP